MRLGQRLGAAAAMLSVLVATAGCGGSDGSDGSNGDSAQPAGANTTPTAPASSSPTRAASTRLTTASFLPATKKAVSGTDTVRTSLRMTAGGRTITADGQARFGSDPAMSVTMNMPGVSGQTKVVYVDDSLYLAIPGLVPAGKYRKFAADDSSQIAKSFRQSLNNMDVRKTFVAFEKGLRKVEFVGRETVDGIAAERYEVTVDTKEALAAQGQKAAEVARNLPKTISYDIWLDSAKRMRQVTFDLAGAHAVTKMKDYGKPVTISAPPASAVVNR